MAVKPRGMTYTPCELIRCREDVLAAFALGVSDTLNVHGMPLELAQSVVCMAVKRADHEA